MKSTNQAMETNLVLFEYRLPSPTKHNIESSRFYKNMSKNTVSEKCAMNNLTSEKTSRTNSDNSRTSSSSKC